MDVPDYDAVIQRQIDESRAELPEPVRDALDVEVAAWVDARERWQREEAALAEDVQRRAQKFGSAWEQVLRAATDPQAVQWRDPAPRGS